MLFDLFGSVRVLAEPVLGGLFSALFDSLFQLEIFHVLDVRNAGLIRNFSVVLVVKKKVKIKKTDHSYFLL